MKVYVVVREDILNNSQKAVQSGHAIADLCYNHDVSHWQKEHRTLVILSLKQGWKIQELYETLKNTKKAIFHEPDLENQATAFAFLGEVDEPMAKKLQLLK